MKRMLRVCGLALCLLMGALTPAGSAPADKPAAPEGTGPGNMPICEVKPWKGFATAEEAAAVPEDAPVCLSPRDKVETHRLKHSPIPIGVDGTSPPEKWYTGVQTRERFKGIEATIQVSNPSVTHSGQDTEFVVSRVMGKAENGSQWQEAGWVEHSLWDDKPYVYTFSDQDYQWHLYPQYALSRSLYYNFRVHRCYVGSTIYSCAYIYWSGAWHLLDYRSYGCAIYNGGTDSQRCFGEAYTEVYSIDSTPAPSIATGNHIDWDAVHIRPGNTWYPLDNDVYGVDEGAEAPYVICWTTHSWDFGVSKNSCP